MAKRKSPEVPALPIPKKRRSGFHGNTIDCGPIPSPAPATGEAIVTGTPAPVVKGKEVATSSGNNVNVLANTSLTFEAMHTLANYVLTYASGQEELARKFKMGTAEVLRLYLPGK